MPLTKKGKRILRAMTKQYGKKKGKRVFYASINAGKVTGAEGFYNHTKCQRIF